MFEVPEAKRVRREDLYSGTPTPSPPASPTLASLLQSQLEEKFSYEALNHPTDVKPSTSTKPNASRTDKVLKEQDHDDTHDAAVDAAQDGQDGQDVQDDDDEEAAFAFRLFSNTSATPKVKIRSPSPAPAGSGGFVTPGRPDSYYFSQKATGEPKDQFQFAAVSGEDILKASKQSCPGSFMPWRVVTIHVQPQRRSKTDPADPSKAEVVLEATKENTTKSKTKPNKKRRIIIRQRQAKKKELKEKALASQAEKEAAEKEKRMRRNREKKIKRREKERAKKAEAVSTMPADQEDAQAESPSSSPEAEGEDVNMEEN
ncbi:hypothetical protein L228DRAFT_262421 [Xylona heveae TC161]|uniref:Uncharacterized protein n=1 Tax=Xylona heveae (strain CBS 132557 / TC161) TaxID=1328760 RepID=A0A165FUK1_XYLHT|nr:hypothetical protein L228DRAFT_262421 [Xylona heveae TC161]KZF21399.1 hypothetical protein L228DRAFT_262421 [Xylona heveae TC161]